MPLNVAIHLYLNSDTGVRLEEDSYISITEKSTPPTEGIPNAFLLSLTHPLCFIKLIQSPWNEKRVFLVVTGTTAESVNEATGVLAYRPRALGSGSYSNDQKTSFVIPRRWDQLNKAEVNVLR